MFRQLIRLFVVAAATLGLAISGMSVASAQSSDSSVAMSPQHDVFMADPPIGAIAGYCSPGQWTQVHWYVHPFWPANYRYRVADGVQVSWRFFSSEPPFYWEGGFNTEGSIWTPPAWYVTIEFMCSTNSPVWIAPA